MNPKKIEWVCEQLGCTEEQAKDIIFRHQSLESRMMDLAQESEKAEDGNHACLIVNEVMHELTGWLG